MLINSLNIGSEIRRQSLNKCKTVKVKNNPKTHDHIEMKIADIKLKISTTKKGKVSLLSSVIFSKDLQTY